MGKILYLILVQVSLFSLGVDIVTIGVLMKRRPPRWYGYALAKSGMIVIIGVILLLVLPQETLDLSRGSLLAWLYVSAVLAVGVGVTVVCRDVLIRTAKGHVTETTMRFKALEERTAEGELHDLLHDKKDEEDDAR